MGKAKARYFRALGYSDRNATQLKEALAAMAGTCEISEVIGTPFGTKYIVDGALTAPTGKKVRVRTVWIVELGEEVPRFVTAYPRDEIDRGVERD